MNSLSVTNSGDGNGKGTADNPYTISEFYAFSEDEWPGGYVEGLGFVAKYAIIEGVSDSQHSSSTTESDYSLLSYPWGSSDFSWPIDMFGSSISEYVDDENNDNNTGSHGNSGSGNSGSGSSGSIIYNKYPQGTITHREFELRYDMWENLGFTSSFLYNCILSISDRNMHVYAEIVYPRSDIQYSGKVILYVNGIEHSSYPLAQQTGTYYVAEGHQPIGVCNLELPRYGSVKVVLYIGIAQLSLSGNFLGGATKVIFSK